jgi:outer membrane protein assembly factor BamB
LEITANGLPVPGSPFPVYVKIPPTQLGSPVKIIGGVEDPIDIAINSVGEMLVAEQFGDVIAIDKKGKKVQSIHKVQYGFKKLRGIVVDRDDNIYLTDQGSSKVFKFNRNYKLVKELSTENINAWGIVVVKEQVVMGSRGHPTCLHVLDRELNLEKTIALETIGVKDVGGMATDEQLNLYICDDDDDCIHVISLKDQGELLYSFGQNQLDYPHSISTSGGLVYVSTWSDNKIFVFTKEGTLVVSFGIEGDEEGQFGFPSGLVFDDDGYLYVCDKLNYRLQLF